MQRSWTFRDWFRSFRADRGAAVAVLFALMLVPLILGVGVAVDFARLAMLKGSLQTVADGAALAGASVLNQPSGSSNAVTVVQDYFEKGASTLASTATIGQPTVAFPSTIAVRVTASATLQTTFMSLTSSALLVSVSATAEGPGYVLTVTKTGQFASGADDGDSIYYYVVAPDGSVPPVSSMTLLFTNDPGVNPNFAADNELPKSILAGANDSVGFALVNQTSAVVNYGSNVYGRAAGSVQDFYSSLPVPSADAYPSQPTYSTGKIRRSFFGNVCNKTPIAATNSSHVVATSANQCNAYPCVTLSGGKILQNNLLIDGACSTPSTAVKTCLQLYNNPVAYAWGDMGGAQYDDYNYTNITYTVSCSPNTTGTGNTAEPSKVTLVQ